VCHIGNRGRRKRRRRRDCGLRFGGGRMQTGASTVF